MELRGASGSIGRNRRNVFLLFTMTFPQSSSQWERKQEEGRGEREEGRGKREERIEKSPNGAKIDAVRGCILLSEKLVSSYSEKEPSRSASKRATISLHLEGRSKKMAGKR